METTTLIMLAGLGVGLVIGGIFGLFAACMIIPRGVDEAWHNGYQAGVEDMKDEG